MVRMVSGDRSRFCILADLQGPKIRTGKLKDGKLACSPAAGEQLTITPREIVAGTAKLVGTVFMTLAENLQPGSRILLSDGLIELLVDRIAGVDVVCTIVNGGMLGENKGINLPGIPVKVPSLTEKDEEDLIFAIGQNVDVVAVSFVRTADDDVRFLRPVRRLDALNLDCWIIAKLEKLLVRSNTSTRSSVADGIMVARGDLGAEVRRRRCPPSRSTSFAGRRSIASRSLQRTPCRVDDRESAQWFTRAEASDVANAIYTAPTPLCCQATAAGKYPVETVAMMARSSLTSSTRDPAGPAGTPASATVLAAVGCRNDLRMHGTLRTGSEPARHRDLHRDWFNRPPAFEVPGWSRPSSRSPRTRR